jgi:hypothetical protein
VSQRSRVRGWLASAAAAAALLTLPLPASLVERAYSRGIFPRWQSWVTPVSNLAPFAVLDVLIAAVAALTLWRAARLVVCLRRDGVVASLWEAIRRVVRAIAVLLLAFLWMWGFNYRRVPLDRTLPPATPSVADLRAALVDAAAHGASERVAASHVTDRDDVPTALRAPFAEALTALGRPPLGAFGRPKHSLFATPFFTAAGVDGMIDPFALETIVHPDLLPFERPFVLAHEWAHLAGTADEAEASAVGWLACVDGGPNLAYSARLYLIIEIAAVLPRPAWLDERRRLDAGIVADLTAIAERQRRQRPQVQRAAFRAYDGYLKANRVEDGVASYSRALSFILSPAMRDRIRASR